jgi:transcriptional regulator with PAS, ATPase and Fis domain
MRAEEFPRDLIRKTESDNMPLVALRAIRDLKGYLERREVETILTVRKLGARADDIAEALGITRQGVYYKLRALERPIESEASDSSEDKAEGDITLKLPEVDETRRHD